MGQQPIPPSVQFRALVSWLVVQDRIDTYLDSLGRIRVAESESGFGLDSVKPRPFSARIQ